MSDTISQAIADALGKPELETKVLARKESSEVTFFLGTTSVGALALVFAEVCNRGDSDFVLDGVSGTQTSVTLRFRRK